MRRKKFFAEIAKNTKRKKHTLVHILYSTDSTLPKSQFQFYLINFGIFLSPSPSLHLLLDRCYTVLGAFFLSFRARMCRHHKPKKEKFPCCTY